MPRASHHRACSPGSAAPRRAGAASAGPPSALHLLLAGLLVGSAPLLSAPAVSAAEVPDADRGTMVMVLDASGSMREPHGDGRTRFAAAVSSLEQVVSALPGDLEVGLRVYGSRISDGPGSCRDSRLVVPVERKDDRALGRALDRARPLGNTPIAYSLEQAAADLPDDGPRTIVLVSDGEESCGGDPCEVARDLSGQGLDLHVDVVGFQVDAAARNQLTCVAQAGRGTFYDAPDARSLVAQLSRLSQRAARAYAPAGVPVEGTDTAQGAPELAPGEYLDTIGDGGDVETYTVAPDPGSSIHLGATTRPTSAGTADLERLTVAVLAADGTECDSESEGSQGAFDELSPVSAALSLDGPALAECGPAPYAVQVGRHGAGQVMPLELSYVLEPEVADAADLPGTVEQGSYDVANGARGRPVKAYGAPAFAAAPVLEPGVYEDSILEGEALYYGVELDWGQQLVCDITYRTTPATDAAVFGSSINGKIRMHGVLRDQFYDAAFLPTDSGTYDGARPVSVHQATPPVRFRNREGLSGVRGASLPGVYYCGAFLTGAGDYPDLGEVPIRVSLDVAGTAGEGAPEYVDGTARPESSTSASAAPEPDPEPSAGAAGEADPGFPLWGWLVAAIAVLGGALALLSRRAPRT